jgi:hypothetical protein
MFWCQNPGRVARRRRAALAVVTLIAVVVAATTSAYATTVERLPLERVTETAARIVHATVVDSHSGRDESGLPATWITLNVARTLKGPQADQLTIKQYGVAKPLPDGTITRVAGLPRYNVGDEVVLFLYPESRRGFTSPVGFGQGLYRVSRAAGTARVRPDLERTGPDRGKPRELSSFLSLVGRLATGAQ